MSDACCGRDTCAPAAPPPAARAAARSAGERLRPYLPVLFGGLTLGVSLVAGQLGWRVTMILAALATIAWTVGGPARRAWRSVRARVLDINALMVIAVAGAVALGDWVEAGAVVWLFAVAQHLEHASQQRARRAAHGLLTLAPDVAIVRGAAGEVQVPAASVRPGDIVVVRPGARFAVDGRVVAGESDVNQAPVTGESTPVEKGPGDEVFAGSVNGNAALEVEATRPASDSTLARIGRLVEQAQRQRAPIQGFVDRFARRYTPAVVLVALAIAIVPPLVTGGVSGFTETAGTWTYRALALLVVACPCALVISTPVSIVSGLTAAARAGVLVKGGAHLERLGRLRAVAFDKTGTLTHGDVAVTGVHGLDEAASPHGVLAVAAALESRSEHPIGRAIVSHAMRTGVPIEPGDGFRALPGFGAEGTVALSPAVVGSHRLFEERQLCTDALHARIGQVERGVHGVLVGHAGAPLGVIGLADRVRPRWSAVERKTAPRASRTWRCSPGTCARAWTPCATRPASTKPGPAPAASRRSRTSSASANAGDRGGDGGRRHQRRPGGAAGGRGHRDGRGRHRRRRSDSRPSP
ncbi:MAG: heavy metal translocating P-type ATPase [Vicinamibacterales bacterium]